MKNTGAQVLAIMLAIILGLVGCSHDSGGSEPRYTVWTDVGTYDEFQSNFPGPLDEGMFLFAEFTNEQFAQIAPSLSGASDHKHSWTKAQLKDWCVGRGFDNSTANEYSSWLASINHGMIASRRGNLVDLILK